MRFQSGDFATMPCEVAPHSFTRCSYTFRELLRIERFASHEIHQAYVKLRTNMAFTIQLSQTFGMPDVAG